MIRLGAKTKLSQGEIIERAVAFFGSGGYGLEVKDRATGYAYFVGGGGDVEVTALAKAKGASVELVSREWDFQVKEFLGTIT